MLAMQHVFYAIKLLYPKKFIQTEVKSAYVVLYYCGKPTETVHLLESFWVLL